MELITKYKAGQLTSKDVRRFNNYIICLMLLVAITSIFWSVSINILSGDFYNGFIGVKLEFRERDFEQMENREKNIFYQDLGTIINETYTRKPMPEEPKADPLIMPRSSDEEQSTTKKPKVVKIAHLFVEAQSFLKMSDETTDSADDDDTTETTSKVPKVKFNIEEDRRFLAKMTIDVQQNDWQQSIATQFIYGFPILSEVIAIIWTAMCFIFQSGVKKHWGLPKPWRIVIPSIIMFSFMAIANLSYLILANGYLKTFCHDLREKLTDPNAISCGRAMSVLRPKIHSHDLSHDMYLLMFRLCYIFGMIFWILSLLIMALRFTFAIDFQLVDVDTNYDREMKERKSEFVEVLLDSPKHLSQSQKQQAPKSTAIDGSRDERHRSEDDFQSAKTHISEVATTPLLGGRLLSTTQEMQC